MVVISKKVAGIECSSHAANTRGSSFSTSSSVMGTPLTDIRSRKEDICGETKSPVVCPAF